MSCHFTKKALRMINFQPCSSHSNRLFKTSFVLKFSDKVNLENTFFVSKSINNLLPSLFDDWFLFSSDQHSYETFWYFRGNLYESSYKTNFYDKNSIIGSPINAWNNSQKLLKFSLRHLIKSKISVRYAFFANYGINCQLSDISNWCLMVFQRFNIYINFNFFSKMLLLYNIHFALRSSFDKLN